jgi:formylglycine-generating enzyme required for sulfatase activity
MTEETKRCPLCYELIHSRAIKCKHCGSILDDSEGLYSPSSPPPPEDAPSRLISSKSEHIPDEERVLGGRYELIEELGRGGMGIVYRANDIKLGINVAIKLLPDYLAKDRRGVESLKREALASMKLSHPNIIRFYHFEDHGDEKFLIMEFVEGKALDEILDESPNHKMAEEDVIRYAIEACSALTYAHNRGVIHRDIKPSNIMLSKDNEIKIGDFGIARVLKESHTRHTGSTTSGTLLYMSPEHILGQKCDARSDIYSLGITLYELLNGEVPFSSGDIVTQHREVMPKPIEGVSDRLNWIILKCLEKESDHRWQNVQALLDVLEGKTETEPEKIERERREEEFKRQEEERERREQEEEKARKIREAQERVKEEELKQRKEEEERKRAEEKEEERRRERQEAARKLAEERERQRKENEWRKREEEEIRRRHQQEIGNFRTEKHWNVKHTVGILAGLFLAFVIAVGFGQFRKQPATERGAENSGERGTIRENVPTPKAPEGMILIQAGEFMMGSLPGEGTSDEHPRHRVSVSAFFMDAHEVTNKQFKEFLDSTGYDGRKDADSDYLKDWKNGTYPIGEDNHPIIWVSWKNAQAYARWADKRLPTEAEWEFACRAGTDTTYFTGNSISYDDANYEGVGGKDKWNGTAPVGDFSPNPWGLYDMHGNVWEWCNDWYDENYYATSPESNPQGPNSGRTRVFRGGAWTSSEVDIRSSNRGEFIPDGTANYAGFRCVKDLE